MTRIGKKGRKVSANPSLLLHPRIKVAANSIVMSVEFSPTVRELGQRSRPSPWPPRIACQCRESAEKWFFQGAGGTGNVQEKIVLINNPRIERKGWSRSGTSSNTRRRHYSHIFENLPSRRPITRQCSSLGVAIPAWRSTRVPKRDRLEAF